MDLLSVVADLRIRGAAYVPACAMSAGDQDDAKFAASGHSGIRAFASTNGERRGVIVPAERDYGMLALLVLVAVARVFIEVETAIGAAIDAELDGPGWILRGIFDLRAHREDRAGAHEEGHVVEGRIRIAILAALARFAGPEVVPRSCGRQIDTASGGVRFERRIDEDSRAEHELLAKVPGLLIRAPVYR